MQQQTITWYKPEEIPEAWKDERDLLCRMKNKNGNWWEILYYCYSDGNMAFANSCDEERRPSEIDLVISLDELCDD